MVSDGLVARFGLDRQRHGVARDLAHVPDRDALGFLSLADGPAVLAEVVPLDVEAARPRRGRAAGRWSRARSRTRSARRTRSPPWRCPSPPIVPAETRFVSLPPGRGRESRMRPRARTTWKARRKVCSSSSPRGRHRSLQDRSPNAPTDSRAKKTGRGRPRPVSGIRFLSRSRCGRRTEACAAAS